MTVSLFVSVCYLYKLMIMLPWIAQSCIIAGYRFKLNITLVETVWSIIVFCNCIVNHYLSHFKYAKNVCSCWKLSDLTMGVLYCVSAFTGTAKSVSLYLGLTWILQHLNVKWILIFSHFIVGLSKILFVMYPAEEYRWSTVSSLPSVPVYGDDKSHWLIFFLVIWNKDNHLLPCNAMDHIPMVTTVC